MLQNGLLDFVNRHKSLWKARIYAVVFSSRLF